MDLLLGSHVREVGNRVGRLAGFELEPASRRIRRIVFSPDGERGSQALSRTLSAISLVHDDGEIELRPDAPNEPLPSVPDVMLLSRSTRIRQSGDEVGRLVGVDVNPGR